MSFVATPSLLNLTFRNPLGHLANLLLEAALVSGFLLQVCFALDGSLALLSHQPGFYALQQRDVSL